MAGVAVVVVAEVAGAAVGVVVDVAGATVLPNPLPLAKLNFKN